MNTKMRIRIFTGQWATWTGETGHAHLRQQHTPTPIDGAFGHPSLQHRKKTKEARKLHQKSPFFLCSYINRTCRFRFSHCIEAPCLLPGISGSRSFSLEDAKGQKQPEVIHVHELHRKSIPQTKQRRMQVSGHRPFGLFSVLAGPDPAVRFCKKKAGRERPVPAASWPVNSKAPGVGVH